MRSPSLGLNSESANFRLPSCLQGCRASIIRTGTPGGDNCRSSSRRTGPAFEQSVEEEDWLQAQPSFGQGDRIVRVPVSLFQRAAKPISIDLWGTKMAGEPTNETSTFRHAPAGFWASLGWLGPGLILVGSIVGSGELVATPLVGERTAGYTFLWLILLSCVIKVFFQIEIGRYAISSGKTSLEAFDEVALPIGGRRINWLGWYWFFMVLAAIVQQGAMVGGTAQALRLAFPISLETRPKRLRHRRRRARVDLVGRRSLRCGGTRDDFSGRALHVVDCLHGDLASIHAVCDVGQ